MKWKFSLSWLRIGFLFDFRGSFEAYVARLKWPKALETYPEKKREQKSNVQQQSSDFADRRCAVYTRLN